MGMLNFDVPHTLSKDEAKKRIEELTRYWGGKYGVTSSWAGDQAHITGRVMGIKIDAKLNVTDKGISGEATDPGMLFRNKARDYLTHKFTSYLDSKKSIDDLKRDKGD
jgi:hypothetical protein